MSDQKIIRLPLAAEPPKADAYIDFDHQAQQGTGRIIVRHESYNRGLANLAKQLGGRWSNVRQEWLFPPYLAYANAVEAAYGNKLQRRDAYTEWRTTSVLENLDIRIPDHVKPVWEQLYSYQQTAVTDILANPYHHPGILLALSPGLGKTVVALTAAEILQLDRVLIVAPLSLLNVWYYEQHKWFGGGYRQAHLHERVTIVHGEAPSETGWVVTNYHTATSERLAADFWDHHWDLLILDESVMIKNRKTQRFSAIKNLRQSADRIWLLSGSPITKHPDDLWAQFHTIEPAAFPSYWRFTRRFCSVEESVWGNKVVGSAGLDLPHEFRDILYVKNQEEVLPDLPEMRFEQIFEEFSRQQAKTYDGMLKEFITKLEDPKVDEMSAANKLAQLIRLQQITSNITNLGPSWPDSSAKHDAIMEMLESDSVETPLLIWTHWRPGANALFKKIERLGQYTVEQIHGSMDHEEVDRIFTEYKRGEIDILILSLGVGKFGHTLTGTKTIIYLDKSWNADDWFQSLHRVRRIGLTHSPRVITITIPGTIDDMVEDNLAGKLVDIAKITNSDLAKLLKSVNRLRLGNLSRYA